MSVASLRAWLKAADLGEDDDRDIVEHVIDRGQDKLAALAALLIAGSITRTEFIDRAEAALRSTLSAGAALGGVSRADATQIADQLLEARSQYLDAFADELDAATDESGISVAASAARMALYAGGAWTAFQMARGQDARGDGDGSGVSITWVCLDDNASCDRCPDLADGSPYTFDTLPTYPGEDVPCFSNCRCHLEYSQEE